MLPENDLRQGRRAEHDVELDAWEVESVEGQTHRRRALRQRWVEMVTPMAWVALGMGVLVGASIGFSVGFVSGVRTQLRPAAADPGESLPPISDLALEAPPASAAHGSDVLVGEGASAFGMSSSESAGASRGLAPASRRSPAKPREATPPPSPEVVVTAPRATSTLTLKVTGRSAAQAGIEADVYVDGVRAGRAPLAYHPVTPGTHRVRFDCVFEGRTYRGTDTQLDVPGDTDAVVEHECDVLVLLGTPN